MRPRQLYHFTFICGTLCRSCRCQTPVFMTFESVPEPSDILMDKRSSFFFCLSGSHQMFAVADRRVRETLDFAARVQGVGVKKAELDGLLANSGSANAPSDAEVDAFLKVCTEYFAMSPFVPIPPEHVIVEMRSLSATFVLLSASQQEPHVKCTHDTSAKHSFDVHVTRTRCGGCVRCARALMHGHSVCAG